MVYSKIPQITLIAITQCLQRYFQGQNYFKWKCQNYNYSLPSINVNPQEWIKVNIYKGVNN